MAPPKEYRQTDRLETIQKGIQDAAKEVAHTTMMERESDARRVPSERRARSEEFEAS